jgi:hypothetical protein
VRLLLYFALGVGSELLVTTYYRLVSRGASWGAASITLVNTLFGFWVLSGLLTEMSLFSVAAYALGNAAGCLLILRRSRD